MTNQIKPTEPLM